MVSENIRAAPATQARRHVVVLASCMGDVPAQSKMANTRGHGAYLPCRYCNITGEFLCGHVRMVGYPIW